MAASQEQTMVKKSIVLHPIMDDYVRKTWAMLIEDGHSATYSMALNFMLLATVMEAIKEEGLSDYARETVWGFVNDQDTIRRLNLQDHLANLRELWGMNR